MPDLDGPGPTPRPAADAERSRTSIEIRRARSGDGQGLEWVVSKFTPSLLLQARYHLTAELRRYLGPEDLVADVWIEVLPSIAEIRERDGRVAPAFVRYLAGVLRNKVRELRRRLLAPARSPRALEPGDEAEDARWPLSRAETEDIVRRVSRAEEFQEVVAAMDALNGTDRAIVVLRSVEGLMAAEVGARVGLDADLVATRYSRALNTLRKQLRGAFRDEL